MKTSIEEVNASDLLERALLHTKPTGQYDPAYTRPSVRKTGSADIGQSFDYTGETFTNLSNPADILTPEELAERLKVDVQWIYEKRRPRCASPIPAIPMGREIRFDWQAILKWLEERAAEDAESLKRRRNGAGTSAVHSRSGSTKKISRKA